MDHDRWPQALYATAAESRWTRPIACIMSTWAADGLRAEASQQCSGTCTDTTAVDQRARWALQGAARAQQDTKDSHKHGEHQCERHK